MLLDDAELSQQFKLISRIAHLLENAALESPSKLLRAGSTELRARAAPGFKANTAFSPHTNSFSSYSSLTRTDATRTLQSPPVLRSTLPAMKRRLTNGSSASTFAPRAPDDARHNEVGTRCTGAVHPTAALFDSDLFLPRRCGGETIAILSALGAHLRETNERLQNGIDAQLIAFFNHMRSKYASRMSENSLSKYDVPICSDSYIDGSFAPSRRTFAREGEEHDNREGVSSRDGRADERARGGSAHMHDRITLSLSSCAENKGEVYDKQKNDGGKSSYDIHNNANDKPAVRFTDRKVCSDSAACRSLPGAMKSQEYSSPLLDSELCRGAGTHSKVMPLTSRHQDEIAVRTFATRRASTDSQESRNHSGTSPMEDAHGLSKCMKPSNRCADGTLYNFVGMREAGCPDKVQRDLYLANPGTAADTKTAVPSRPTVSGTLIDDIAHVAQSNDGNNYSNSTRSNSNNLLASRENKALRCTTSRSGLQSAMRVPVRVGWQGRTASAASGGLADGQDNAVTGLSHMPLARELSERRAAAGVLQSFLCLLLESVLTQTCSTSAALYVTQCDHLNTNSDSNTNSKNGRDYTDGSSAKDEYAYRGENSRHPMFLHCAASVHGGGRFPREVSFISSSNPLVLVTQSGIAANVRRCLLNDTLEKPLTMQRQLWNETTSLRSGGVRTSSATGESVRATPSAASASTHTCSKERIDSSPGKVSARFRRFKSRNASHTVLDNASSGTDLHVNNALIIPLRHIGCLVVANKQLSDVRDRAFSVMDEHLVWSAGLVCEGLLLRYQRSLLIDFPPGLQQMSVLRRFMILAEIPLAAAGQTLGDTTVDTTGKILSLMKNNTDSERRVFRQLPIVRTADSQLVKVLAKLSGNANSSNSNYSNCMARGIAESRADGIPSTANGERDMLLDETLFLNATQYIGNLESLWSHALGENISSRSAMVMFTRELDEKSTKIAALEARVRSLNARIVQLEQRRS